MTTDSTLTLPIDPVERIPGLADVARRLEPYDTCLVGPALLRLAGGLPVDVATLWTTAPRDEIAARLPRAVPRPGPSAAWGVACGETPAHLCSVETDSIEAALATMPIDVLAVGVHLASGEPCGAASALESVACRSIHLTGPVDAAASADALLVLRIARLVSELGFSTEPEEAKALAAGVPALDRAAPAHRSALLNGILLGDHADRGVALLDQAGLREAWLGRPAGDAGPSIDALPSDFALRLLAWLDGSRPAPLLRRARIGVRTRARLVRLAEHQPIEQVHTSLRPRSLRRLLELLGHDDVASLIDLRRVQLERVPPALGTAADARGELERLSEAITAFEAGDTTEARPPPLAVNGRHLMAELGLGAGPVLGGLLTALAVAVESGEVTNDRDELVAHARRLFAGDDTG